MKGRDVFVKIEYLWKDRKRFLGMPITFTRYRLSEDRLFVETGFLNIRQEEVLLYRIRDITLTIHLGQRIFGVGSVLLMSSDKTTPQLTLKNIKNPREVKELIHRQVEEAKIQRRLRVGEIMNDVDNLDPLDEEEGFGADA